MSQMCRKERYSHQQSNGLGREKQPFGLWISALVPLTEKEEDGVMWWEKVQGKSSLVDCNDNNWCNNNNNRIYLFSTSHFHFHSLEKEMATHSSVLAWRIPGTGEPSMGSHRVGHDWRDLAAAAAAAAGIRHLPFTYFFPNVTKYLLKYLLYRWGIKCQRDYLPTSSSSYSSKPQHRSTGYSQISDLTGKSGPQLTSTWLGDARVFTWWPSHFSLFYCHNSPPTPTPRTFRAESFYLETPSHGVMEFCPVLTLKVWFKWDTVVRCAYIQCLEQTRHSLSISVSDVHTAQLWRNMPPLTPASSFSSGTYYYRSWGWRSG